MSSRRKSSNPCMVRVVNDVPDDEPKEPKEAADLEVSADSSESSQSSEKNHGVDEQEETPENPDQQSVPEPQENQNPEPLEHEERSPKDDVPPNVEAAEGKSDEDRGESESMFEKKESRGYECKYCPFVTQNLSDFKEHVDTSHPNVILNPVYVCAPCTFSTNKFDSLGEHNEARHPGESNFKFKRIRTDNQTILEQTIEGKDKSAECEADGFLAPPCEERTPESILSFNKVSGVKNQLENLIQKDQITAVTINGTVIIPEPSILQGLSHVSPLLQLPPNLNCVPKIAVPLNTTKYNPSLDNNLTLITSFNKFPYPTHAELSWLTAASKHPQEQIKVWFTTQRLKQGITWSPEEVEEARKKMFNGSIPPTHHMFTSQPTSPVSAPSIKASLQPVVHTTVEHPGQVRTTMSNGLSGITNTNSPAGVGHSLKRHLPSHMLATFGPESKRPIMAVAPHPGEPKDKGLMAPPPAPPPQKDHLAVPNPMEMNRPRGVPLVSAEMKRSSVAVPLLPSSPLSPSLPPKGRTFGNSKTKPLVSLPSILFPESLTRPTLTPLPYFGPPFKNTVLIPRLVPKEKSPLNSHPFPAPDQKLQNSPPLIPPLIRRPTIIQSIQAPPKVPGFPLEGKKGLEQYGMDVKAYVPRGDKVLNPLAEVNGTWSHGETPAVHNNQVVHLDCDEPKPDFQHKSSVLTQFPLLERMKGKTAEQLKILEENFLRNSFPTHGDVDHLSGHTHLSHQEIDSWFVERRALRDNMEQALLNSMGTKRTGAGGLSAGVEKLTVKLNGNHKPGTSVGHLKIPAAPLHPLPIMATPVPYQNSYSVPPDSRSLALLKDDFRWPSPEELGKLDSQIGLTRADLARWFNETRRQSGNGGAQLKEHFHTNGFNGGQGPQASSPEGAMINSTSTSAKVLDAESGWFKEQRANNVSRQYYDGAINRFSGRCDAAAAANLRSDRNRILE